MNDPMVMSKYDFVGLLTAYGLGRKEIAEILDISVKAFDAMMQRDDYLRTVIEESAKRRHHCG